jgi:sarcosine dehydrogenase
MEQGARLWDTLAEAGKPHGIVPFGIGVYGTTGRLEKGYRAHGAELELEFDLVEADMLRPKVKEADFRGKAKHLEYKAREHQPAMLCTLVMAENTDSKGVNRYPVGSMPVMDPETGKTLVDSLGRISYTTSVAYGPTIGKNIALAYLPQEYCQVGRKLNVEYFAETYPVEVAAVGYKPLYDPENLKPRT